MVLFEEESLWAQKSRSKWIIQDDKNTKFFHQSTLPRRHHNRILALKDENDCWVYDSSSLQLMVRSFFMELHCQSGNRLPFCLEVVFQVFPWRSGIIFPDLCPRMRCRKLFFSWMG